MSSLLATLDACVLVPDSLRDVLLRAANEELYQPFWSQQILDEVARTLVRVKPRRAQQIMRVLRDEFEESLADDVDRLPLDIDIHEEDRHVAAAAVRVGASVIVTANVRDFPQHALDPFNVVVQTPDEFLLHLLSLAPQVVIDNLHDQAAMLQHPPMTVDDLLDKLTTHAPGFVTSARKYLREQDTDATNLTD